MFQGKVKTEWLTKGALSPTNNEVPITVLVYLFRRSSSSKIYFNKAVIVFHYCILN
jgi:hypothetical protein